jgi:hypothetical protein
MRIRNLVCHGAKGNMRTTAAIALPPLLLSLGVARGANPIPASRTPGGSGSWAGHVGVPGGIPNLTSFGLIRLLSAAVCDITVSCRRRDGLWFSGRMLPYTLATSPAVANGALLGPWLNNGQDAQGNEAR